MKKRGFTLIELLAVIVILSIIVVIAVTKIGNVIEDAKRETFKSTNKIIINQVSKLNGVELVPQTYTFTNGVPSPDIQLSGEMPTSGTVEINANGEIQLATSNSKFCAIKRFNESEVAVYDAGSRLCNIVQEVTLTINPNGGTYNSSSSNTTYEILPEGTQSIEDPVRDGYIFTGWSLTCTSCFVDKVYTMSEEEDILTAQWTLYPKLTVNLNGGTTTQIFNERYFSNTQISLTNPTKDGYIFLGWISNCESCLNNNIYTMDNNDGVITADWLSYTDMYAYTGNSTVINDGSGNWRIKFLTNGTFTPKINMSVDAFLVGGGGGGGYSTSAGFAIRGGAGGGYTATYTSINLTKNTAYSIVIGAGGALNTNGGSTSAFLHTVNGGTRGYPIYYTDSGTIGGNGGSGGGGEGSAGGSNGSNGGSSGGKNGGTGQNTTTREFGESTGTIYSYGGAGTNDYSVPINPPTFVGANTGTGGNGAGGSNSTGGSGIVVVRNARIYSVGSTSVFKFSYSGSLTIIDGNTDNWKVKFLTSGTLKALSNKSVSAFLVGGGGGGGYSTSAGFAIRGGAGGGYTATYTSNSLVQNTSYTIVIGVGGAVNSNGGSTSAFGHTVNGGLRGYPIYYTDSGTIGGNGGSGGGGEGSAGGSNGSNGTSSGGKNGGTGQNTTTREFGESTGTIYSYGGAGTNDYIVPINPPTFTGPNTGTGGNGASGPGEIGGSGIVVIRSS